jgi:hypothetical protein
MTIEFVHVLRNVAKGSDGEIVILTNANTLKAFRSLLAPAVERARERDEGDGFEEGVAAAVKRIEENSWLAQGVNNCLIDSRWDWSDWQFWVHGTAFKDSSQPKG